MNVRSFRARWAAGFALLGVALFVVSLLAPPSRTTAKEPDKDAPSVL